MKSTETDFVSRAEVLVDRVRRGVIGKNLVIEGPYGPRAVVYADYTASGRALDFIEEAVREVVLPWYANTHSESSGTGRQTNRFREEARQIVHDSLGGDDSTAVIFTGSGATGAVNKLVAILGLNRAGALGEPPARHDPKRGEARPVVFIGPYEHHSNDLPWRESNADVVRIPEDDDGHVDLPALAEALERFEDRPLKVGAFSAASNVTGIITDTRAVSRLLHAKGALATWDFAAAAPYLDIDMNPAGDPLAYMDAVALSPHKFVGGPGTPGVLAIRRELVRSTVPSSPGGGTVSYVSDADRRYLDDPVLREESGTPDIIGSIRAGLVFALKSSIGPAEIQRREEVMLGNALASFIAHPAIEVLGSVEAERLSIVSLRIRGRAEYLHHNFVVALLNDLFGIQVRGGCSCAGPYGHRLLDINESRSRAYGDVIARGWEGLKPGWVRVNFNYFISSAEAQYIVDAIGLVAECGERFLEDYTFDPGTGQWTNNTQQVKPSIRLTDLLERRSTPADPPIVVGPTDFGTYLKNARSMAATRLDPPLPAQGARSGLPPNVDSLRDFVLPSGCVVVSDVLSPPSRA